MGFATDFKTELRGLGLGVEDSKSRGSGFLVDDLNPDLEPPTRTKTHPEAV